MIATTVAPLYLSFIRRLLVLLLCAGAGLCNVTAAEAEQVLVVGVTAFRDKAATTHDWQPTMDFLSASLPGLRFEVRPLNLPEFEDALQARSLDFLITNPQHYITVESKYSVSRVATLVKAENGKPVNVFGGVVFTRAERDDIRSLADLRGKRIAATDKTSFAAYLIQSDLMLEQGLDPVRDCKLKFMGFPQDLSVQAVLDGQADAGFVRSGLLEAMAREGKLDLSRLRVINPRHQNDFPFLVSSELFPEWPLAAAPQVSIDITNRVVAALLLMPPNAPAAQRGRYYRWSTPVEYQSVQSLMQRRHIYPFDKPQGFRLQELLHAYAGAILSGASVLLCVMAVLYWRAFTLNRQLVASKRALSALAHHDALTGLPNRVLMEDRLAQALARAGRGEHSVALCMLDLDAFKPINDRYGHATGDRVLQELALRIQKAVREVDTVARFGGDEFMLLINGFGDDATLDEVMRRVIGTVSQPLDCCPRCQVSASIGVSVLGSDAHDAATLMRHADEAMYQVKSAGGNGFRRFVVQAAAAPV